MSDPLFLYREYDRKDSSLSDCGAEPLADVVERASGISTFGGHKPAVSVDSDPKGISRIVVTDDEKQYYLIAERLEQPTRQTADPAILAVLARGPKAVAAFLLKKIKTNS